MKVIAILFLLLLQFESLAQDQSSGVREYMEVIRQGKAQSNSRSLVNDKRNEKRVLEEIEMYLKDTVANVRLAAYTLLATIAKQSTSIDSRQRVVSLLVGGWRDADSGIAGAVGSHLQQFRQSDFNSKAKDSLQSLVRKQPPHYTKLVLLCGYLGMTDLISILKSQINSGAIKSRGDKSAVYFALCRLGDEQMTQHIMNLVEAKKINDDLVYDVFPDLIYTRQRIVFDYLIKALNSDEKNCESANPEINDNMPCAYRIMELLAPVIKDFPLKTDASGDITTPNYPEALYATRSWFKRMGANYVIVTDTF